MKMEKKRFATFALSMALGLGAIAPFAMAKEDVVKLDKVPKAPRKEIEKETKGASEVEVYQIDQEGHDKEVFMVHYTGTDGKRMEIRVTEGGKLIAKGETRHQRAKDAEMQLASAKTDAERAQIQAAIEAKREADDKAQFEAYKAQQAALIAAHPAAVNSATPVVPGHAPMTMKDLSEEYNATSRTRVTAAALPAGVKATLDKETLGTSEVDYFKYVVDGKTFYSSHYTTGAGRRIVCRVDETGKLLGKNELVGTAATGDAAAVGSTGASGTTLVPPNNGTPAAPAVVTTPKMATPAPVVPSGKIEAAALPAAVKAELDKETLGTTDIEYYKTTADGKTVYSAHYTTSGKRRMVAEMSDAGKLLDKKELKGAAATADETKK